eukprot:scaffold92366_cov46-Prasinocladus_malaysianus.AAC.1
MEDRDPYWARPWHSAVALAEELLERPELVSGKSVVDVGYGQRFACKPKAMPTRRLHKATKI